MCSAGDNLIQQRTTLPAMFYHRPCSNAGRSLGSDSGTAKLLGSLGPDSEETELPGEGGKIGISFRSAHSDTAILSFPTDGMLQYSQLYLGLKPRL